MRTLKVLYLWVRLQIVKVYARIRAAHMRRKIRRGLAVVEVLDDWMTAAGYGRHERRQFWREFAKRTAARSALVERLK